MDDGHEAKATLIRLRAVDKRRLIAIMAARGMTTQVATIRLLLADEAERLERERVVRP
jgi:hypothetical protein